MAVFWVAVVIVLLLFSLVFKDTDSAIVAQVEPMKHAISYHKAVRIEEIYVIPGQTVEPGDVLLRVERPDLVMDEEKKKNEIENLKIERSLSESKYRSKRQQLTIEKETNLRKVISKIEQLKLIMSSNLQLSHQFNALTGYADTLQRDGNSFYEIELQVLDSEKEVINDAYKLQIASLEQVQDEELRSFDILATQLQNELNVLNQEQEQQVKTALIHGTIGSVNAQPGELLAPYTSILSIYESNPSIIKAVMNEGYKYDLDVGDIVKVESSNRRYSIDGKIIEIGARIIEYPNRLKTNENMQMWGQEVFIKIPKDNMLLNGERVYVSLKQ